mmetsp:Transcript_8443/g.12459  ORF Transcript_8443/g.12459 Transcript_8443/m.12459 type:complete len:205 (-) Transcript_8443:24-638(-)
MLFYTDKELAFSRRLGSYGGNSIGLKLGFEVGISHGLITRVERKPGGSIVRNRNIDRLLGFYKGNSVGQILSLEVGVSHGLITSLISVLSGSIVRNRNINSVDLYDSGNLLHLLTKLFFGDSDRSIIMCHNNLKSEENILLFRGSRLSTRARNNCPKLSIYASSFSCECIGGESRGARDCSKGADNNCVGELHFLVTSLEQCTW